MQTQRRTSARLLSGQCIPVQLHQRGLAQLMQLQSQHLLALAVPQAAACAAARASPKGAAPSAGWTAEAAAAAAPTTAAGSATC
jgi:hypothetical protein